MADAQQQYQQLLDAKTKALTEADQIIGDYRSKTQQKDQDFEKFRGIVQSTERRCEDAKKSANLAERTAKARKITAASPCAPALPLSQSKNPY